jgi:hypothetical protein
MYKTAGKKRQRDKERGISQEGRRRIRPPLRKQSRLNKCLNSVAEFATLNDWVNYLTKCQQYGTAPDIGLAKTQMLKNRGLMCEDGMFDAEKAHLALKKLKPKNYGEPLDLDENLNRGQLPLIDRRDRRLNK